ncbi:MAG TPA: chemotaxis protein CheD [Chryseolinea sp.]|nr:chemotaxis protein CheD [Chryseolinea sp.]
MRATIMDVLEKKYVLGGQLVVAETPMELVTIVGSCVAVCLWDRKTGTAGMNHYMLPSVDDVTNLLNGGKSATRLLIKSMVSKMSDIKNLEAKIFGGGNKFFSDNFLVVGLQNVEAAKQVLMDAGIPIVLEHTGGIFGRKVYFDTRNGNVSVTAIE